ncbi:unnamed protein product, partial [Porites evermanni]
VNYGPSAEQILLTLVGEHEMLWGKENEMLIYFVLVAMPCVQVTRVGVLVSAPLYLNGGIPQGTKLGLVLFAVVVNDLVQSWGVHIKFVDDLAVLEVVPRNSPSLL